MWPLALTPAAPKFTSSTSLKCLLQLAPTVGGEISSWGISFDGTTANTPVQVELCEVDVPATGGTASFLPVSYVTTAISSTGTTSLATQCCHSTFGYYHTLPNRHTSLGRISRWGRADACYRWTSDFYSHGSSWDQRHYQAFFSIPIGTTVYALPGTGCPGDIVPTDQMPVADPTWATCAQAGTALTGFNFTSSYPSTVQNFRSFDAPQIPPTAPYVIEKPPERGWEFSPGRFVQVRITASVAVECMPWITFII